MVLIIVGIVMVTFSAYAQKEGYIETYYNDTIQGYIIIPDGIVGSHQITFFHPKTKTKTTFSPIQIKGFAIGNQYYASKKFYVNQEIDFGYYVFMQKLLEGTVSIYFHENSEQPTTFKQFFLEKEGEKAMEYYPMKYRRQLSDYLFDCPEIVEDLENNKYKRNDLVKIIEKYNNCNKESINQ